MSVFSSADESYKFWTKYSAKIVVILSKMQRDFRLQQG